MRTACSRERVTTIALAWPSIFAGGLLPEVLDDDLGLRPPAGTGAARRTARKRRLRLRRVHLGVVARMRVGELVVRRVRRVAREHVEDEALVDRLTHRVGVERPLVPVRVELAEGVQRLRLRGRREGEERQVLLLASVPRAGQQQIVGSSAASTARPRSASASWRAASPLEDLLQLLAPSRPMVDECASSTMTAKRRPTMSLPSPAAASSAASLATTGNFWSVVMMTRAALPSNASLS